MTVKLEGLLPVSKTVGSSSFTLVRKLRKLTGIKKIGHAGTLDPFATGVMVLLIGRPYTKLADKLTQNDKEYEALIRLGVSTTTYDPEGEITATSERIPSLESLKEALEHFQGRIMQTPPMFSAKKVQGQKLYQLARRGLEIERKSLPVDVKTTLLSYDYPHLKLHISCSKGTYIRSIAHDLGQMLSAEGHLEALTRTRSGAYTLDQCVSESKLVDLEFDYTPYLMRDVCLG